MKGTVTRLRLLSLSAAVLVVAAAIAVAATPRRAPQAPAAQPPVAKVAQAAAPVAPVAAAPAVRVAHVARHETPAVSPQAQTAVRNSAGLMIYRDPETGDIGIDPASATKSVPGFELNDSDEGLVEETLPDGSKMVNLQGRFQEVAVMHIGPDGKMHLECSKHPVVVAPPAPTPVLEER